MEYFINNILDFFKQVGTLILNWFTNNNPDYASTLELQAINGTLISMPYNILQYIMVVIPIVVIFIIGWKVIRSLFRLLMGKLWR